MSLTEMEIKQRFTRREHDLTVMVKELEEGVVDKYNYCRRHNISERQFRRLMSEIALIMPVVALSSGSGYRICKDPDEVELIKAEIEETVSRINNLKMRLKPLMQIYFNLVGDNENEE